MKKGLASLLLGWVLATSTGCFLHLPYGDRFDANSTLMPPIGRLTHTNNLPPAERLMEPGPGIMGPGPGVMMPPIAAPLPLQASQVAFVGPDGMAVTWDISSPGAFDSEPLIVPARYNFPQAAIYRLKLTNIPGRAGVELYPTLEVAPSTPRTDAYLAHNAIPVQFTEEDLDQVLSGNFVTKVIYLPDAEFQELALAGVETLVSTRLDPGVDPIVEADRRGTILAIIRVGNKDLEIPGGGGGNGGGYEGGLVQASYNGVPMAMGPASGFDPCTGNCAGGPGGPGGAGGFGGAGRQTMPGIPPSFVSGMTAPQWGMPITGTPIGLPGPPHLPMGSPAGLQAHSIKNKTKMHIPGPVKHFRMTVKQEPGFTYPDPVASVHVKETNTLNPLWFKQPMSSKYRGDQTIPGCQICDGQGECADGPPACPPGPPPGYQQ